MISQELKEMDLEMCECGHSRAMHGRFKAVNLVEDEYEMTPTLASGHGACCEHNCNCGMFTWKMNRPKEDSKLNIME